ncbi:hypothetical protein IJ182_09515 [bacterium]|nr:hypothetical protein [bacterium]
MTNILNSTINTQRSQIPPVKNDNVKYALSKSKQVVSDGFENSSVTKVITDDDNNANNKKLSIMMVPFLMGVDNIVETSIAGTGNNGLLKKIANVGDRISHTLKIDNIISKQSGSRISKFLHNNRFFKYFTNDFKTIPKSPFAKGVKMAETFTNELISNIGEVAKSQQFETVSQSLPEETSKIIADIAERGAGANVPVKSLLKATDELIANGIDTLKEGNLLTKYSGLSATKNKLVTAMSEMGDTVLGSGAAKAALKTKNIITYGGGLLSMYFMATALINAVKAAKEAPKGEKKSTFMHVLSEQYVGIILFQPSMNLLYKAGGNKYRGMTAEARNTLKNLIQSTNSNPSLTKEGLKIAKIQRDLLIKGVDKDKVMALSGKTLQEVKTLAKTLKGQGAKLKFWEKPLKFAGRILSAGLDKMKIQKIVTLPKKLPFIGNEIKIPQPTLKGVAGGLLRFAIIMFVLQPLLQKPLTKLTHKIFGEPKAYLAKNNKKTNEHTSTVNPINVNQTSAEKQETNLIKIWENK